MNLPQNLVDMGYIASPFGIQGWVKIKVATEYTDSLADYEHIYLKLANGSTVCQQLEDGFARNGIFHAKLTGVNDREQALALRGATIAVERDQFPQLDTDEFYWVDLIGLNVVNLSGEPLGIVKNLMETGANDVLVVAAAKTERLIPFVAQYIINVDLQAKQITVDWGMDY